VAIASPTDLDLTTLVAADIAEPPPSVGPEVADTGS